MACHNREIHCLNIMVTGHQRSWVENLHGYGHQEVLSGYDDITRYLFLLCLCLLFGAYIPQNCLLIYTYTFPPFSAR